MMSKSSRQVKLTAEIYGFLISACSINDNQFLTTLLFSTVIPYQLGRNQWC